MNRTIKTVALLLLAALTLGLLSGCINIYPTVPGNTEVTAPTIAEQPAQPAQPEQPAQPAQPTTESLVKKNGESIYSANELSLYDVVTFGRYPQTEFGTEKPIEWYVIKMDGNKVRLLSRYCLDSQKYHGYCKKMNFEQSDLYQWLNGTFKNAAFSSEEQRMLYNNITLPNSDEAFALPQSYRAATGTEYAIKIRGFKDVSNHWWLSDPAEYYDVTWDDDEYWPRECAQTINFDGSQIRIFPLNYNKKGVRPMIEIQF